MKAKNKIYYREEDYGDEYPGESDDRQEREREFEEDNGYPMPKEDWE